MKGWLGPGLLFLYFVGLFAWMHSGPGGLVERDGYYHARAAQLLPSRGLSRDFEWTQASTWKDAYFDKEFLYHLFMAPFARGEDPVRGALVYSVLLSAGVFLAFFLVLRRAKVPSPWLAVALLACMGGPFLLRLSFIRSHVLSVLLLIIGMRFLIDRNWKALGVLGFAYSWSYTFPLVLPAITVPFVLGRRLAEGEEKLDWRSPAAALGGVLLGLIIHPYAPNSLETLRTYFEVISLALTDRGSAAVEVGREFAPYSTRSFLIAFPVMTATLLGLGLAGWRAGKKLSGEAMGMLTAATTAFIATMVFLRFIEYSAPLTAAAAALAMRDTLDSGAQGRIRSWAKASQGSLWITSAGLFLILAGVHVYSLAYVAAMRDGSDPPRFQKAAKWMEENLKPGETVVNLWWDDFPDLFYSGYRQHFLTGLDPTYSLRWDQETAGKLEAMRTGRIPLDAEWLAKTFDARVMALRSPFRRYYPQLAFQPPPELKTGFLGWQPVYQDEYAAIFALTGEQGPPPEMRGLPQIPALP